MSKLYIGLMSGTSADGINAVLVDFAAPRPNLLGHHYQAFPPPLQNEILRFRQPGHDEINRLGDLDVALGKLFANAVNTLLHDQQLTAKEVIAIGSHGQTVRHAPERQFTLQIGDPNIIAAETGITTVGDFRRRDMALGGQGAPLVPAFHQAVFASTTLDRVIVNVGGIANITVLKKEGAVLGFDTGPGNTLLDNGAALHLGKPFDEEGRWAATGTVNQTLLNQFLADPFFQLSAPKSTGPDYFNQTWLMKQLLETVAPVDVQATLTELTARTIVNAIKHHVVKGEIFICGGGAHNHYLLKRIAELALPLSTQTTEVLGVGPDWIEAMAFAWLAQQTIEKKVGNITTVTGAKAQAILGGVYETLPIP